MRAPIFAIDPGNTQSAYCIYSPCTHAIEQCGIVENHKLKSKLREHTQWQYQFAIEMVASYGMPVGKDIFETVLWIGRFVETVERSNLHKASLVYRKEVKHILCGSLKAKDANIRQAVIDRFPATGGGKNPTVGTKSKPGPLFGVSKDIWAAIGVALTYHEKQERLFETKPRAMAL
jgi:hypothetical protein